MCRGTHRDIAADCCHCAPVVTCEGETPEKRTYLFYLHFIPSSVRFLRPCGFGFPTRTPGLPLALSQRLPNVSREAGLLAPSPLILVCRGKSFSFVCEGRSRRPRSRVLLGFPPTAVPPRPLSVLPRLLSRSWTGFSSLSLCR